MSDQDSAASGQATTDTAATTNATDTATSTATTLLDGDAADAANTTGNAADGATATDDTAKTGDETGETKQDDTAEKVPDQYEDFTMPDGVEMHAEVAGEFKALAKDLGLTQTKAQQVADLGAKLVQAAVSKQAEAIATEQAKWANDSRADKEFGGDNLKANLGIAKAALDKFGTPELKELLNQSALGNHPEVIRLLHRVGKAVSEDTTVRGGGTTAQVTAQSLYPNSKMN